MKSEQEIGRERVRDALHFLAGCCCLVNVANEAL